MEVYLHGGPMDDRHLDVLTRHGEGMPAAVVVSTLASAGLRYLHYEHSGELTGEGVPVYRPQPRSLILDVRWATRLSSTSSS